MEVDQKRLESEDGGGEFERQTCERQGPGVMVWEVLDV